MQHLYYVEGFNSWANKDMKRAFNTKTEADDFAVGLTEPNIYLWSGKTKLEAFNNLLMNLEGK